MIIKRYTKIDLVMEMSNVDFWKKAVIPISKQRAISQINNPRADATDVLLIVCYEENQVIGYIGILPDRIYLDEKHFKIGWLTTWLIDSNYKSTGVGAMLFLEAMDCYQGQVCISGFSESAGAIYKASRKFITLKDFYINVVHLNLSYEYVKKSIEYRVPCFARLAPVLKPIIRIVNICVLFRQNKWYKKFDEHLKYENIEIIDEETNLFIEMHRNPFELSNRGEAELNWIKKYPWVTTMPINDINISKYAFNAVAFKRFFYLFVKVFEVSDRMVGFLVLKVKDDSLTVCNTYFEENARYKIINSIFRYAIALKVKTIYSTEVGIENNTFSCPIVYSKKNISTILISKALKQTNFDSVFLQFGDGDTIFT